MEETKLIGYLLEKEEIILPTILLKQKAILELEQNLKKGRPLSVAQFFKKVYDNFDEYIDIKGVDKLFKIIKEISEMGNSYHKTSEDNKKIIEFLVKKTEIGYTHILEIVGQRYFILQVAGELEKSANKLPDVLKIALFMWCFVNIYELLLHEIDRRLLAYFKTQNYESKNVKKFLKKVKREKYGEHATAGLINNIFCEILNMKEDNNSIFGKSRLIRNKISHSNMFYDSEKREIILLNGKKYTVNDFLNEYYKVFDFLCSWINKALGEEFSKERIISDMKKYFKALSSSFLDIERNGLLRKVYGAYILKLKKEAGIKNASTTN